MRGPHRCLAPVRHPLTSFALSSPSFWRTTRSTAEAGCPFGDDAELVRDLELELDVELVLVLDAEHGGGAELFRR